MEQTITLSCGTSSAVLALPESGLYTGVRFDHAGVFREIRCGKDEYSGRWLEGPEDPSRHDNVTGPSEEFFRIGYDEAPVGGLFLKIGVGMLRRKDETPYSFTNTYDLVHPGTWTVRAESGQALFRHVLEMAPWGYDYRKEVRWEEDGILSIGHDLINTGSLTLEGTVYNHNFFTFGGVPTGSGTTVDFPFTPEGTWRNLPGDAPVGQLNGGAVRLDRNLAPGEKVCIEQLVTADGSPIPYRFSVGNTDAGRAVSVRSDAPVSWIQFWGNHRVACVEPFTPFSIAPGESFRWTLYYQLEKTSKI